MFDHEPKLKRGLSDISPLFSSAQSDPVIGRREERGGSFIKVLSVCDLTNPDLIRLNASAAAVLAEKDLACAVVSFPPQRNEDLSPLEDTSFLHLSLEIEELARIVDRSIEPRFTGGGMRQVLFLAPDYSQTSNFPLFFDLLDQLIVVVDPVEESLREAYKLIKGTRNLNKRLQYSLVFRNDHEDMTSVYESFSRIFRNRLRTDLAWLGYLTESAGSNPMERINFENLFMNTSARLETPGKIALADFAFRAMKAANRAL